MRNIRWPVLTGILLFCALAFAEGGVESQHTLFGHASGSHDRASVLWQLGGEFRHVFANLLWIKMDKYHHELEEHKGTMDQETEVMPLIRLITWLDPQFAEAYATGAWLLSTYLHRPKEAKTLLDEGVANNPRRFELYETMGWYYLKSERDIDKALKLFRKALQCPVNGFDRKRLQKLCETIQKNRRQIEKNMLRPESGVE